MKYNDLPASENPHHRINEIGSQALNTTELLAVALWINDTDTANDLAAIYRTAGGIGRMQRNKVMEIKGLGAKVADALSAVAELARREVIAERAEQPSVTCPADAVYLVQYEMSCLDHEELRVILLDTRNKVIRVVRLYKGSLNSSTVRVSELFRDAIIENAASIILVHNHPSGDTSPSPEDVQLTRTAVQTGKMMDIDVLDHMIIGGNKFTSLKERGLGFSF
jgi:DNA repair protein RadC